MRVVGGTFRGLKLVPFGGEAVRPTADRVKESLFNILGAKVVGARCLDLFCGSGSLGIECLSRGAAEVVFNDISDDSLKITRKNLVKLKDCGKITVKKGDFASSLASLGGAFGLIFIDPPYASDAGVKSLEIISSRRLLEGGGIAVYERDRPFSGSISGLELFDERRYGKTYISFFAEQK